MKLVIIIMSMLAIFLGIVAVGLPVIMGDSAASRLKAIRKRRDTMRKDLKTVSVKTVTLRERFTQKSLTQRLADKLKLSRLFKMDNLKIQMLRAGWRGTEAPARFLLASATLPLLMGGYAAFLVYGEMMRTMVTPLWRPFVVAGVTLLAFCLPWILLKNAVAKRSKILSKQFPDALDLMLVCVEAGLTVEQSFTRITQEIGHSIPEISDELALTAAELALLGERRVAFDNLVKRVQAPEFKSLATSLIQTETYGTSVASSLRTISEESRKSRIMTVEKKAASLSPKMTVPMIMFILPCLFLVLLGPSVVIMMAQK